MQAPFPWFGGKSSVSEEVWDRFGNVQNYVEPFFGSGAVLLNRPHPPGTETVNDLDCLVANFWRALQHEPELVAHYADNPVNEADQHARHLWLSTRVEFREQMKVDPDYYCPKVAGWWVWGQCIWIGSGWCQKELGESEEPGLNRKIPELGSSRGIHRKRPHLGNSGTGIHRKLPHLGSNGTGINRQLPHLGNSGNGLNRKIPNLRNGGMGVHRKSMIPEVEDPAQFSLFEGLSRAERLLAYMLELSQRLRNVRVCCGDWSRLTGPSVTVKHGVTGIFLDPPYSYQAGDQERTPSLYVQDSEGLAHDVRKWALEIGEDPLARVALCGYEGEHNMPPTWECIAWKARGGYGSQGENQARENSRRERIWFSPYCLRTTLFSELKGEPDLLCAADS